MHSLGLSYSQPVFQHQSQVQPQGPIHSFVAASSNTEPGSEFNTSRRRRRSPSVQIMDARPRQRPRLSDEVDRVMTPDLNAQIKIEEGAYPNTAEDTHDRSSRAQAPTPQPINPPERNDCTVPATSDTRSGRNDASTTRSNEIPNPNLATQQPLHRQLLAVGSHRNFPAQRTAQDHSEEDEEEESEVDDEIPVPSIQVQRPQVPDARPENLTEYADEEIRPSLVERMSSRRAFNAYRVKEQKPLSYAERQELELRYCARVAMIIGSKRCVLEPCLPISTTKNIFTIMRQKFGHPVDDPNGKFVRASLIYANTVCSRFNQPRYSLPQCSRFPHRCSWHAQVLCQDGSL